MTKYLSSLILLLSISSFSPIYAIGGEDPFEPKSNGQILVTAGIGASYWGLPLFARFAVPIKEDITLGASLSYQTNNERYSSNRWRHNIIGMHVRGNYHFNTLLNSLFELSSDWDIYSGLTVGYYVWKTTYRGDFGILDYGGRGIGGVSMGIHVGGRYFVNERIGINLEVGGDNVLGGATVGATFML